jgi:hypothetical protein
MMDANLALSQLSSEMGDLEFGGNLAEPAGSLEDIGTQSVVESAPTMGSINDLLAGEAAPIGDLVGTGVAMDELAPAAPPIGDAPSAAEVAQAVDSDGALAFIQPPANATVSEAMAAVASQASPEARSAVGELAQAGAPIDAGQVAQATGSPTDVIRALASQAQTQAPTLKDLESQEKLLRQQLGAARNGGDAGAVSLLEAAVAAKQQEVLAATNAALPSGLNQAAAPIGGAAPAATPAAAPAPAAPPLAGQQRRRGGNRGSGGGTKPPQTTATATPQQPAPQPAPTAAAANPAMTRDDYAALGRQLGFVDPPFDPFAQNSGFFTELFGDGTYKPTPTQTDYVPQDFTSLQQLFAPKPDPNTWMNLPGRMGGAIAARPKTSAALGAAGAITIGGLINANKRREPVREEQSLTEEDERLLQDYDARRAANPMGQQPSLNPQQPARREDNLRMLLQPRP